MANYSQLKAAIADVIKTNGTQAITGQVLQDVLNSIVSVIGVNYTFAGVATPSTNPGTPDQNVVYFAMDEGVYTNFGNQNVPEGFSIFLWNGSWQYLNILGIDDMNAVDRKKVGFIDFPASKDLNGIYINNDTGKWATGYNCQLIPIIAGQRYRINANDNYEARYCFLQDDSHVSGSTPNYAGSYTTLVSCAAGTFVDVTAPSDATLLYVAIGNDNRQRAPKDVRLIDIVAYTEETRIKNRLLGVEDASYQRILVDISSIPLTGLYISGNTWTYTANRNETKIVPITAGKLYKVETTRSTYIAFIKSFDSTVDVDGSVPDFCIGYETTYSMGTSFNFIAPSDANYVVLRALVSGNSTNVKLYELEPKEQEQMKVLIIGDSWGRDSACELWSVAQDMGVDLFVAQAYQGGSGLYNQFKGMDDATRTYNHNGYMQYTQGTYQLWEYYGNMPTKTPSTGYNNGKCGVYDGTAWGKDANGNWAAKTLAECLSSHDWDIILIRLNCGDLQNVEGLTTTDDSKGYFDINDFITRMEQELTPECLAKVKWGLETTWSYPEEAALTYTPGQGILQKFNIADWSALTDEQKQAVYAQFYPNIQSNFPLICNHLGNKLSYAVNIAKAIQLGRKSNWLKDVAWHMNRSSTDMHLGNGIPKYICALEIMYSIFNRSRNSVKMDYIPDLIDGTGDNSDGGSESNPTVPTKSLCVGSVNAAWQAACEMPDIE